MKFFIFAFIENIIYTTLVTALRQHVKNTAIKRYAWYNHGSAVIPCKKMLKKGITAQGNAPSIIDAISDDLSGVNRYADDLLVE
jgi:hypothetical protein